MLELKIQCDCGQKIKFDVEPVDGHVPFTVTCPLCGRDDTDKADAALSLALGAAPPAYAAPAPRAAPVAAPLVARPTGLRISRQAEPAHAATPEPVAATQIPETQTHGATRGTAFGAAGPATAKPAGPKPNFGLGVVGALVGTVVGSVIYFCIFYFTGIRLYFMAVGVGYLAGLGADLLSRKEGSKELGILAATFTIVGVICSQYFAAHIWWRAEDPVKNTGEAYKEMLAESKKVMQAVPNGTDQEIRTYLASADLDKGEKPDPASVTDQDIADFKKTWTEMRDVANGTTTAEAYTAKIKKEAEADAKEEGTDEGTFKAYFLLMLLRKFNLISLAAGAGLAF